MGVFGDGVKVGFIGLNPLKSGHWCNLEVLQNTLLMKLSQSP